MVLPGVRPGRKRKTEGITGAARGKVAEKEEKRGEGREGKKEQGRPSPDNKWKAAGKMAAVWTEEKTQCKQRQLS